MTQEATVPESSARLVGRVRWIWGCSGGLLDAGHIELPSLIHHHDGNAFPDRIGKTVRFAEQFLRTAVVPQQPLAYRTGKNFKQAWVHKLRLARVVGSDPQARRTGGRGLRPPAPVRGSDHQAHDTSQRPSR